MTDSSQQTASLLGSVSFRFTDDYRGLVMILVNQDGQEFATGVLDKGMNNLIGSILNAFVTMGTKAKPADLLDKPFEFTPVPAGALAIAPSNLGSDIILSVQIGPATLSFSVPASEAEKVCTILANNIRHLPKSRPN